MFLKTPQKSVVFIITDQLERLKNMKEKYFIVNESVLNGILKKIKRTIDFGKFVNTKTLADTDDQLPNDFTLIMR